MTYTARFFQEMVRQELISARESHKARFNSAHEAYGVILEEVREFEAEVFRKEISRSKSGMLHELTQIAAMAQRAAEDLGLVTGGMPSVN